MLQRMIKRGLALLRGWQLPPWDAGEDPYAAVKQPKHRGPTGRESAIAVSEPEPDQSVDVLARPRR
jgi:hypothetical protein